MCGYKIFLGKSIKSANHVGIEETLQNYSKKNYAFITDTCNKAIYIIYRKECCPEEMLESYFYAVLSAMLASNKVMLLLFWSTLFNSFNGDYHHFNTFQLIEFVQITLVRIYFAT